MTTKWFAVLAALNLVFGMTTGAQDVSVEVGTGGEVVVEAPPVRPEKPPKPERPERPQTGGISQEMKELVSEFRSKVADFHVEQKELIKKLKNATEEERSEIREQLKANRDELKQVKEEFRDSVKDVTGSLKEQAARVAAETKVEVARGRGRD